MLDLPPPSFHCHLPNIISGIIKLPSDPGKDVPYHELPCSEEDRNNVIEIVTTVGSESKLELLFNQTYLKGIGARIQHIHPLMFLEIAISSEYNKACTRNIMDDFFKKPSFMGGLGGNLTREKEKGKLEKNIEPFAQRVGVSKKSIQHFFDKSDWDGLVRFLLK